MKKYKGETWHTNGRPSDIPVQTAKNEREMKRSVLKAGKCPVSKSKLTTGNLKQFIRYINSMDLEKIRGLSGKYPAVLNISRTGSVALM